MVLYLYADSDRSKTNFQVWRRVSPSETEAHSGGLSVPGRNEHIQIRHYPQLQTVANYSKVPRRQTYFGMSYVIYTKKFTKGINSCYPYCLCYEIGVYIDLRRITEC